MRKTFKYRIYANVRTIERAENWLTLCRWLYNAALQQRITAYKQNRGTIRCYEQMKQLPELKEAFPEYCEINGQVLQEVLWRLEEAYQNFFRRWRNGDKRVGYPRFRGKNRFDSFTLKQWGYKLDGKYLSVTNVGRFKLKLSRPIQGDIKTVTIKRTPTGKWYVYFSCDNVPEHKLPKLDNAVGIDVGINSFCVDSDGNSRDNPLYFKQSQALIIRRHRKLSRSAKGSNRRNKARILLAKAYEKVTNQRHDHLHKLANEYIKNYGTIYVENLNFEAMYKHPRLAKYVGDSSWGKFFMLLSYKAVEAGRIVVKVPPKNTSQMCSSCGEIVPKKLNQRVHSCPYCGLVLDRDENAARNILARGLLQSLQPLTCGVTQSVG